MTDIKKFLLLVVVALAASSSYAKSPSEAEFVAARLLGGDIASWIGGLKKKPRSIGIFNVKMNSPLDAEYGGVVEAEVIRGLSQEGIEKVLVCAECRVPIVSVLEDRLVVSKASPDSNTFKQIGAKVAVDTYLVVEVYKTGLNIQAQAVLYSNPSAVAISAESFTIPTLSFSESSVQLLITLGAGRLLGQGASTSTLSTAANVSLLEEVGFGKAGLNVGTLLTSGRDTLIYVAPTLAFRSHFGHSGIAWSLNFGAGYGFAGSTKGILARVAFETFLGSWSVLGLEGNYLVTSSGPQSPIYAGFHVGISFGR